MDVGEKIGITISAVGGLIDAAEIFFPGAIGKMTPLTRKTVFAVGTSLVIVGLIVMYLSPESTGAPTGGVNTVQGNGNCSVSGSGNQVNCAPALAPTPPLYAPITDMPSFASGGIPRPSPDRPCLQSGNTISGMDTGNGSIYVGNAACNNTIKNITQSEAPPSSPPNPKSQATACPPGAVICDHEGRGNNIDCVRGNPGSNGNVVALDRATGETVHDVQRSLKPCESSPK